MPLLNCHSQGWFYKFAKEGEGIGHLRDSVKACRSASHHTEIQGLVICVGNFSQVQIVYTVKSP